MNRNPRLDAQPDGQFQPARYAAPPGFAWPAPQRYLPFRGGRYTVAPGMRTLKATSQEPRGLPRDDRIFQFDADAAGILKHKAERRARPGAHARDSWRCITPGDPALGRACAWIAKTLAEEWPQLFQLRKSLAAENDKLNQVLKPGAGQSPDDEVRELHCVLTGDRLHFNERGELLRSARHASPPPDFRDLFDALAAQVPEDLALWRLEPAPAGNDPLASPETPGQGRDWLAAIELAQANHWAPEEKIGRSFAEVHAPVAGMEVFNQKVYPLLEGVVRRGPQTRFERFAWGLGTDCRRDQHPLEANDGRNFDPERPALFVRAERQTLTGFADCNAFLFTIRTSFADVAELVPEERADLAAALGGMSAESLAYKGLARDRDAILAWLANFD